MRKLLLKTARRQMKRMRLNEAIESFFQLIVATNGQLCGEEMWMLFEVCQLKITQTFDFYQRVATVIKSMDCNNNSSYIFEELWTSMVEDLRTECSEMFDLTIKIKVEGTSFLLLVIYHFTFHLFAQILFAVIVETIFLIKKFFSQKMGIEKRRVEINAVHLQFFSVAEPLEESCLVEKLKYLIAAKVCALWVEITSVDHDEVSSKRQVIQKRVLGKQIQPTINLKDLLY